MAGFKRLLDANLSLRESLREQENIPPAATYLSAEDFFEHKLMNLKLLNAKQVLLEAHTLKDTPEVTTSVVTEGNVLQRLGDATEKAVVERSLMKFIAISDTVKNLFHTPVQELTSGQVSFKQKIRYLLRQLADEELKLSSLQEQTEKAETRRNELLKIWDETLAELHDKASGLEQNDNEDDQTDLPGKRKLQEVISKMDTMKSLIGKLITQKQYDWITDRADLKPLLLSTRENYTVDMFDE